MLPANSEVFRLLPEMPSALREKTESMLAAILQHTKVVVAFSGGVDSTLVAYLAKLALGRNAVAVTAASPSLPASELEDAENLAARLGFEHLVIQTDELQDPNYTSNPSNRCYFCKTELATKLRGLAQEIDADGVLDGTNADDLNGHRPGAVAMSKNHVDRPLAEAGMSKEEVRTLSQLLGLPNHDKPSMPCLSSRIQYGQVISPERLRRVEDSEKFIRNLTGVKDLRVRDHGNLARIEVGRSERSIFFDEGILDKICSGLREFGFTYVTFDLSGYRSGSMNETKPART